MCYLGYVPSYRKCFQRELFAVGSLSLIRPATTFRSSSFECHPLTVGEGLEACAFSSGSKRGLQEAFKSFQPPLCLMACVE